MTPSSERHRLNGGVTNGLFNASLLTVKTIDYDQPAPRYGCTSLMHSVTMSTLFIRLLQTVLILALPIVLVIGSVQLLVTDPYLAFEYNKTDFPVDPYGFSQADRLAYASSNFQYVRVGQNLDVLADQRLGEAPLYNTRELNHMQDVQKVYQAAGWVWQISLNLILIVSFALAWRPDTRPALATALKRGGLLTVGLVGAVGLLALVAWQVWFVAFHEIFFAAGTWTFNLSDTLIRLFPEKFWFDAALTLTALSWISGLLLILSAQVMQEWFALVHIRLATTQA